MRPAPTSVKGSLAVQQSGLFIPLWSSLIRRPLSSNCRLQSACSHAHCGSLHSKGKTAGKGCRRASQHAGLWTRTSVLSTSPLWNYWIKHKEFHEKLNGHDKDARVMRLWATPNTESIYLASCNCSGWFTTVRADSSPGVMRWLWC